MRIPKLAKLSLCAATILALATPIRAQDRGQINVHLPEAPPLSASSPDLPRYTHEITDRALSACGFDVVFEYTPWKRAQQVVQEDPRGIIIPLARTIQREPRFQWVAPIAPYHYAFATLDETLDSLEDITPDMAVAAVSGTAQWDFLLAEGIARDQLTEMIASRSLVEMIATGRVDAWFEGVPEIYYRYSASPLQPNIVVGRSLYLVDLYIAAGLDFDPGLANQISKCISDFRQTAEYEALIADYLPGRALSPTVIVAPSVVQD